MTRVPNTPTNARLENSTSFDFLTQGQAEDQVFSSTGDAADQYGFDTGCYSAQSDWSGDSVADMDNGFTWFWDPTWDYLYGNVQL